MKFEFGVQGLSGQLRAFANKIDAGDVLPQTVVQQRRVTVDDFEMFSLVVKYAEAKK